jgi:hypothetical protein
MTEDLYLAAYRAALSYLAKNCDFTPEEWVTLPALLRENLQPLLRAGHSDPVQIASVLVGVIRQKEQVRRSATRLGRGAGRPKAGPRSWVIQAD